MRKCRFKRTYICAVFNIIFLLLVSGCWSSRTIEDLNIIVGSALDRDVDGKIKSTLQYAVPEAMTTNSGGVNPSKPYINVVGEGISLEPSGWETTLSREGYIFGSHQKTVVISEELARTEKLRELTDLYFRDIDIRGSTLIFIAKGIASQALETKEANTLPAMRLAEIANGSLTSEIVSKTPLIKMGGLMNSGSSFLLQLIEATDKGAKFSGGAIFNGKKNKMIGTIDTGEVEGINWITAQGKGGAVKGYIKKSDGPIWYQIESIKSKITPHIKGDKVSFDVKIESEGRIAEYWNPKLRPLFNEKNVTRVEKNTAKVVKVMMENVTKRLQNEFKTDVAGFGNAVRIQEPKKWNKLKNNWDELFSKAKIKYDVKITIRDYGMIGKKKNK
ncbi:MULTISPECIES: Ger(x)C family spore germination protein [unclassified Bacillus (in: firmicutes)]|uniref:Ger(x)C family spore germination protein n=1 Tax=unclassified Bacillus (in: firmicutes) TaxID=185979 RepID=UPI000BEF8683|nr:MULTISPECIES: Ger(x)C family spore germination protein [unclassified Bacillus (in: firmicutes)]PEJ48133.1 spore gernimation protein GerC [Bacillus sp. AFS002410]PEL00009.1 spore gernimation protein GerC [Bacillus sp. AFS017336]